MNNGQPKPAERLAHDWKAFVQEREAMRKRLPPNIPPQDMVNVLMLDVAAMAKFMTRVVKLLEEAEAKETTP